MPKAQSSVIPPDDKSQELNQLRQELKLSKEEFEQFVSVISHDLQEPLHLVSIYLELLLEKCKGKLDSETEEYINHAKEGAQRSQKMIRELSRFAVIGTRGGDFLPTNLNNVLKQVLSNLKAEIETSGAVIAHDELPTLNADVFQITQLFQSLISNSLKFRGDRALKIHVTGKRAGNEWTFFVKDNGIGIAPENHEKIFKTFYRVHGSQFGGTGMGLPVSKKIVQRHGGLIGVESLPGEGSSFFFTIPEKL